MSPTRDESYVRGVLDGLSRFAWWKDSVQYVGTTGTTLRQAEDAALVEAGLDPAEWRKTNATATSRG